MTTQTLYGAARMETSRCPMREGTSCNTVLRTPRSSRMFANRDRTSFVDRHKPVLQTGRDPPAVFTRSKLRALSASASRFTLRGTAAPSSSSGYGLRDASTRVASKRCSDLMAVHLREIGGDRPEAAERFVWFEAFAHTLELPSIPGGLEHVV